MPTRRSLLALALGLYPALGMSRGSAVPLLGVVVTDEDGFKTIRFPVTRTKITDADDGSKILLVWVGGIWAAQPVGMGVALSLEWEPPSSPTAVPVWFSDASFERTGSESDTLLGSLSRALDQDQISAPRMKDQLTVTVANLDGEKPTPESTRFTLKMFYGESETEYAEMYMNIDVRSKTLAFSEKDAEYRAPFTKALTA